VGVLKRQLLRRACGCQEQEETLCTVRADGVELGDQRGEAPGVQLLRVVHAEVEDLVAAQEVQPHVRGERRAHALSDHERADARQVIRKEEPTGGGLCDPPARDVEPVAHRPPEPPLAAPCGDRFDP
jgi:hypothetical protein